MADDHNEPSNPPPVPARSEPTVPGGGPLGNHQPALQAPPVTRPAQAGGFFSSFKNLVLAKTPTPPPSHPHDSLREVAETVVFVVVLVLLLKSFIAEAFVIPTGSMADTLWGYQKVIICPQCGHEFPVNCSQEVEPQDGHPPVPVVGCTCPNCRLAIQLVNPQQPEGRADKLDGRPAGQLAPNQVLDPGSNSGDRVLVAKYLYDFIPGKPERFEVVVFKYPEEPQKKWVQMNYIKRLIGLGNETIGIHYGDIYSREGDAPPAMPGVPYKDYWRKEYTGAITVSDSNHPHSDVVNNLKNWMTTSAAQLKAGDPSFKILQKGPEKVLAMRRLVFDNDKPAKDLEGVLPPRWAVADGSAAWSKSEPHGFHLSSPKGDQLHWLRYRHILRGQGDKPQLITDFLGYNTYEPRSRAGFAGSNWVGDLILECEVKVDDPAGDLVLELSKGVERFRARWDLASGKCTLWRLKYPYEGDKSPDEEAFKEIASAATALRGKGTYQVRLGNVDERLTVWIDGKLPFDSGVSYAHDPPKKPGPYANDLEPASIGVTGGTVSVHKIKLWRDTYYTLEPGGPDVAGPEGGDWSDPRKWAPLQTLAARTFYIQPGHYLCLGDNSPESSDGRSWGAVPERLMLGRALLVYYPFAFPIWPLNSPVNRVGPIK